MSNAFFQVGCSPKGMLLKITKESFGGEAIDAKEVIDYLNKNRVLFSASDIAKAVEKLNSSGKKEQIVLLNKDLSSEIPESYILKSTPDKLTLSARFYPPSLHGNKLSPEEFMNDLRYKGVVHGVDEEAIRAFFDNRIYCTDVVVANGTPVIQGEHARIEYYFETELSLKPALNEDGSVDFSNLQTYTQCHKGDILARLFPAQKGTPGKNLFGEPIPPLEVKRASIKHGRNLSLSEDGLVLTADVSGHVSLVDDKVFLSDVLEIENVGPATGNIDYDGNVCVKGNVQENFEVKATGTVEVKGVVEGALIESGEDIIIARGMKGMGKGKIKAGRNIIAKFIENSDVSAESNVQTDSILHSNVMAGVDVIVSSHKGFITGGRVCAANKVVVKTLGTEMGADTIIEVGGDPNAKKRMAELQKLTQEATRAIEQARPVLENFAKKIQSGKELSYDQKIYMQTLLDENNERKANLEKWLEEIDAIQLVLERTSDSCVDVTGEVYQGTRIYISDVSMMVKSTISYCRFIKREGDVKMVPL